MEALPEKFALQLRNSPEAGMGYWIVSVRTDAGERFDHVVIDSGYLVEVAGFEVVPFRSEHR